MKLQVEVLDTKVAPWPQRLTSPEIVASFMSAAAKADREFFWVIHLNNAKHIIEKEIVSIGTVTHAVIHPREVFKKAILNGSVSIITVHNHPGGSTEPSKHDLEIWDRLDKAGELLGIEVLDHLIITPRGYFHSQRKPSTSGL